MTKRRKEREAKKVTMIPGTKVVWSSQSCGYSATKEGVVVYNGTPFSFNRYRGILGDSADGWVNPETRERIDQILQSKQSGRVRADACTWGIVVRVERKGKTGKDLDCHWYCPNPTILTKIAK